MERAVAWLGPVGASQVAGASVPGAPVTYVSCTGDGSPDCAQIGASIGATAGGSIVGGLLRRAGVPNGELVIGSFSAGHEITKPALMAEADRARVRAVLLADSTYSSWADQAHTRANAPEGYVRYALDAVRGNRMFVATASHSAAGAFPAGYAVLKAVLAEVEARSGRSFQREPVLPGVTVPAEEVWRLGNVWLASFGPSISHAEHATKLAPMVWRGVLLPWLDDVDSGRVNVAGSSGASVAVLSAVAGWYAAQAVMRRLDRGT